MSFAVNLYMDEATEELVRAIWSKLAKLGVSDKLALRGTRPHVALMVFDDGDPGEIAVRLRNFSKKQRLVECRFEHLGTFCSNDGVLFLAPVVSPRFFLLQTNVFGLLNDLIYGIRPGCRPHAFVPHCTVAYGLDKETLSKTVSLFSNKALPIAGWFNRIGLVDIQKNEDRCIYSFSKLNG